MFFSFRDHIPQVGNLCVKVESRIRICIIDYQIVSLGPGRLFCGTVFLQIVKEFYQIF